MLYVFYFNDKCDLNLCLFKKEIGMNFFFYDECNNVFCYIYILF